MIQCIINQQLIKSSIIIYSISISISKLIAHLFSQFNRCIEDKDIFEAFYRDLMGRRLLSNRFILEEVERFVVTRLQIECGKF